MDMLCDIVYVFFQQIKCCKLVSSRRFKHVCNFRVFQVFLCRDSASFASVSPSSSSPEYVLLLGLLMLDLNRRGARIYSICLCVTPSGERHVVLLEISRGKNIHHGYFVPECEFYKYFSSLIGFSHSKSSHFSCPLFIGIRFNLTCIVSFL